MGNKWIQGAIHKPGALKATARREGAMNPDGTIKRTWLHKKAKGNTTTARRARLALTLGDMHRHE